MPEAVTVISNVVPPRPATFPEHWTCVPMSTQLGAFLPLVMKRPLCAPAGDAPRANATSARSVVTTIAIRRIFIYPPVTLQPLLGTTGLGQGTGQSVPPSLPPLSAIVWASGTAPVACQDPAIPRCQALSSSPPRHCLLPEAEATLKRLLVRHHRLHQVGIQRLDQPPEPLAPSDRAVAQYVVHARGVHGVGRIRPVRVAEARLDAQQLAGVAAVVLDADRGVAAKVDHHRRHLTTLERLDGQAHGVVDPHHRHLPRL